MPQASGRPNACGVLLSPLAAYTVDLLTTQDDLGRAIVMLTGVSLVFLFVLLLARDVRHRVTLLGTA